MKTFFFYFTICFFWISPAQEKTFTEKNLTINKFVDGTLTTPINPSDSVLAIIIGGSGPTDRNGNQNYLKNDALKKLAHSLAGKGIASFRYDKRIIKQIQQRNINPNLKFDDFVTDAVSIIEYFNVDEKYDKIFVIGHSQGSLVGMLASENRVDGLISLAGAGQNIGDVLIEQVGKTAPQFNEDTKRIVEKLKSNQIVQDYPEALATIFKIEIQPFMMNWMAYNPTEIIAELNMPILIINGTKDLQVSVDEAKLLHEATSNSELVIIDKMNHVLVDITGDDLENSKSYNEPYRKLSEELVNTIATFILSDK